MHFLLRLSAASFASQVNGDQEYVVFLALPPEVHKKNMHGMSPSLFVYIVHRSSVIGDYLHYLAQQKKPECLEGFEDCQELQFVYVQMVFQKRPGVLDLMAESQGTPTEKAHICKHLDGRD